MAKRGGLFSEAFAKLAHAICSITMPNGNDLGQWLIGIGHSDDATHWGRHPYLDAGYQAVGH